MRSACYVSSCLPLFDEIPARLSLKLRATTQLASATNNNSGMKGSMLYQMFIQTACACCFIMLRSEEPVGLDSEAFLFECALRETLATRSVPNKRISDYLSSVEPQQAGGVMK